MLQNGSVTVIFLLFNVVIFKLSASNIVATVKQMTDPISNDIDPQNFQESDIKLPK